MQINRLIFPGFWFDRQDLCAAQDLARRGVGGFCLYGGTREQIYQFTRRVRAAAKQPLLICADYEDGLGRWVKDAPRLAPNLALGAAGDENLAFEKGLLTALQARELGVDWVFAPVVDLADTPNNPIVNARAFSAHTQDTVRLARAFIKGLTQGGVLNCLKHFPGHGQTETDSHLAMPVLQRSLSQLLEHELIPFTQLLPLTHGVMTGHLLLPQIDAQHPASFSPVIQTRLLKQQLGWNGCVLTDALLMRAIGDEKQASLQALQAGSHILLAMNDPLALMDFLASAPLPLPQVQEALTHIETLCQQAAGLAQQAQGSLQGLTSFNRRVAQASCVQDKPFTLTPGQSVKILPLADQEQRGYETFAQTLQQAGISLCSSQADCLIILTLSNYKSFKGHINLTPQELEIARQEAARFRQSVLVCLGSPFAAAGLQQCVQSTLHTFCPLKEFQQTAAEVLLGRVKPAGRLPVTIPDSQN